MMGLMLSVAQSEVVAPPPPPAPALSFVDATSVPSGYTGTALAATTPSGVSDDDVLLAYGFHRGATSFSPPAGWTVIESVSVAGSGVVQTTFLAAKDAVTSADASAAFTWSQAPSGRIEIGYIVLRPTSGAYRVVQQLNTTVLSNTYLITPLSVAADAANQIGILVCSTILQSSSGGPSISPSAGSTLVASYTGIQRGSAAYQLRNAGQSTGGTSYRVGPSTPGSTNGIGAVSVMFGAD